MRAALLACAEPAAAAPPRAAAPARAAPRAAEGPRRSRALFWVVVVEMVIAIAGGGAIAFLGRERVAERKGQPDTIAPAAAQAATAAPTATATPAPAPTATATPTPTATATPTATPTPTPDTIAASATSARTSRRDRDRAQALFRKAEARRAAQDVDGAIRLYLAAEASDPGLAEVQKKLALCYQLKGDRRRAAERYRRYLATGPDDAERVRAILSTLQ
jgi:tetratricopeptide (TPR) repeat protein